MPASPTGLVTIGARHRELSLVELQAACHQRIRENLALARRLSTAVGHSPEDVRETAQRIHRYFSVGLPLHIADEDCSIAPRLRTTSTVVSVTLEVLEVQHETYQPLVDWLLSLLDRVVDRPDDIAAAQRMIGQTLDLLESQLLTHLELEEQAVFPALERLPLDKQADIVREMRRRREV
ncbi:MAG: hemerythrin domain-containing protein [Kofleriaceae bacterium]